MLVPCRICGSVRTWLYRHEFVNNMVHVKLICKECFSSYHVDKELLPWTIGTLTKELIIQQRYYRKTILRKMREQQTRGNVNEGQIQDHNAQAYFRSKGPGRQA